MSERTPCPICDFPLATGADLKMYDKAGPHNDDDDLRVLGVVCCWSEFGSTHRGDAIDWRARALETERRKAVGDSLLAGARIVARDAEARVKMLEGALRVAREALSALLVVVDGEEVGGLAEVADAVNGARAALELLRAHVEPTPETKARADEAGEQIKTLTSRVQELEKETSSQKETIDRLQALVEPWRVCAQALADEVDLLVRRQIIDSRSPAADALLDFRNPPTSPRSDRLLSMSWSIQTLVSALERSANNHRLSWSFLDALCSTDTSVDRRKARDNAIQFEKEDRDVLSGFQAELKSLKKEA